MVSIRLFNEPINVLYAYVPQREHVIDISFPHKWFLCAVTYIKISVSTFAMNKLAKDTAILVPIAVPCIWR